MTTIAYRDGILAYDSRRTAGDMVTTDNANKLQTHKGVKFVLAGAVSDFDALIAAYFGVGPDKPVEAVGYAVDGGQLWQLGVSDDKQMWKCKVPLDGVHAMGTGFHFAYGAMDMGASAQDAVKIAARRDIYTGGRIRHIKVR